MIRFLSNFMFLQYLFNCFPRFLMQEFSVFLLTPRHGLLHHAPARPSFLSPAGRCGFNRISGICPMCQQQLRHRRAKCNAGKYNSRKSGDDIPVRVRPAIVRIQNPEASIRPVVQIAESKPRTSTTARVALQVHIQGESPSVRLPPAIHP